MEETKTPNIYVIEGCDGVGKTTIATRVAGRIQAALVNDPNTALPISKWVRHTTKTIAIPNTSKLSMFITARLELINNLIVPIYNEGKDIVLDRFWPSTLAYQSYGGDSIHNEFIARSIMEAGVPIHTIFILHDSWEVIQSRVGSGRDLMESTDQLKWAYDQYTEMANHTSLMGYNVVAIHSGDIDNAVETILQVINASK